MFESAEIGHRLKKSQYRKEVPPLREALLAAQYQLLEKATQPVMVLINGIDGAGKGETVNLFNEWMDPRHIRTHAFAALTGEEAQRPEMWRFWRALPAKGHIGILFGSWYTDPILKRVLGHEKKAAFDHRLERIRHFERMLVAEGTILIKLWFHLSRSAQKTRLKQLSEDPLQAWRVSPQDWANFKQYDAFVPCCEYALRATSTAEAPWTVIDGSDAEYRSLTAGRILLEQMQHSLELPPKVAAHAPPPPPSPLDQRNILNTLDYTLKCKPEIYDRDMLAAQSRLAVMARSKKMRQRSVAIVFEGNDAAGKGSTIRRLTSALDARFYNIVSVAAPSDEERAQPYLWRFWRHIPAQGRTVIFDRSWYGRVLVERVEGFAAELDWQRAYEEINAFEDELAESGVILIKFWLAITPEEQLRRFRERESVTYKRFKLTAEDWRNRDKWKLYEHAVCDMVDRTSTEIAPWYVIPANDKRYARLQVLTTVVEIMARHFGKKYLR